MEIGSLGLVGVGALIGFLAGAWEKVKGLLHNIASVAVVSTTFKEQGAYAASMYLTSHFKRLRLGDISVCASNEYVRPEQQNQLVAFKVIPAKGSLWRMRGSRRIVFAKSGWRSVVISFIRGTFNPDHFITATMGHFNDAKRHDGDTDRFFVVRKQGTIGDKVPEGMQVGSGSESKQDSSVNEWGDVKTDKYSSEPVGWKFEDIGEPHRKNAVNMLSLSDEALAAYEDIKVWRAKEKWYKERFIPWKLGWSFVGLPGTGKTAFLRAVGQDMNMPVFIFDIASMTNKDFVKAWEEALDWSPCIVLVDNIHAIYRGTERIANTGDEPALTFDCFLTVLDGVDNTDGIVLVITTNDESALDHTLGGKHLAPGVDERHLRPGRVDRVVHFDILDEKGRFKMARRIIEAERAIRKAVDEGDGMTGAEFQDLCRRKALGLNGR